MDDDKVDVPWDNQKLDDKEFAVAITGKTFNHMYQNRDKYEVAMRKILYKAQIYARMSPDDKANLVDTL